MKKTLKSLFSFNKIKKILNKEINKEEVTQFLNKEIISETEIEKILNKEIISEDQIIALLNKEIFSGDEVKKFLNKEVFTENQIKEILNKEVITWDQIKNILNKEVLTKDQMADILNKDILAGEQVKEVVTKELSIKKRIINLLNKQILTDDQVQQILNQDVLTETQILKIIKNKNTWILVMCIVLAGLYGYFVKDKVENVIINYTSNSDNIINEPIEMNNGDIVRYNLDINSDEVVVDFVYNYNTHTDIVKFDNFKVDEVATCGNFFAPQYVGDLQNLVVVGYHTGCSLHGHIIKAYSTDGTVVKTWRYIDNNNLGMEVDTTSMTVIGDTIIVHATNFTDGPSVALSQDEGNQVYVGNDTCTINSLKAAGIDENYLVSATYKIKYLGNNQFADPVILESTSIKAGKLCGY